LNHSESAALSSELLSMRWIRSRSAADNVIWPALSRRNRLTVMASLIVEAVQTSVSLANSLSQRIEGRLADHDFERNATTRCEAREQCALGSSQERRIDHHGVATSQCVSGTISQMLVYTITDVACIQSLANGGL